ncbi:FAD-dependent oxidoreductase [Mariniflexile sp.]|uniref:FAD-dependent oxidoreductase n=1 Tax=Mariniflexile sp. TaxID=1979402 RepID=UPI004047CD7C
MKKLFLVVVSFLLGSVSYTQNQNQINQNTIDVLVIGGGASGTMAGIQAARMDVSVLILEETPWLGGMLTSAGVSAVDGNYNLHSGLWEEYKQALSAHYGGEEELKTGWVSNVLYEPQVGAKILLEMTKKEPNLQVVFNSKIESITKSNTGWEVNYRVNGVQKKVQAKIVIDATELGDIAAKVGVKYAMGMDSKFDTGEEIAPEKANNIVQDLTYVAILKTYKDPLKAKLDKPKNYDPTPFLCTCKGRCSEEEAKTKLWDCDYMMEYGKLPNGYYMINWPIYGNDYYTNIIELNAEERARELQKAKDFTLNYVYYLQNELGYKNLGIADDVYPTEDGLPFIPYHRESRRINGLVRFTVNDLARPFQQEKPLYRTGIAVGDYPIDHHHNRYPEADKLPDLHFYPVPSYSIPLGTLIPKETANFIVSEKSISVTNIVNGTTRLQPVCILIGQASGALAALSAKQNKTPAEVSVRQVQKALLDANVYLMPYSDIEDTDPAFKALQRIGATGMLKGKGKNIGWKNHTHIYPDSLLTVTDLKTGLKGWTNVDALDFNKETVSYKELLTVIKVIKKEAGNDKNTSLKKLKKQGNLVLKSYELNELKCDDTLKRKQTAVLLDELLNPFEMRDVNHFGELLSIEK